MKKITLKNLILSFALVASTAVLAQANDDFANAEPLTCGANYTGTTAAATLDEDDAPDG
jgi:hypothetical protein